MLRQTSARGTRHFKFVPHARSRVIYIIAILVGCVSSSSPVRRVSRVHRRVSCTFSALSPGTKKKEFCFCSHDLYALVNVMSCIHQTYSHGQPRNRTLSLWTSLIVFFYFCVCVCESVFELFFSSSVCCTALSYDYYYNYYFDCYTNSAKGALPVPFIRITRVSLSART